MNKYIVHTRYGSYPFQCKVYLQTIFELVFFFLLASQIVYEHARL